MSRRKFFKLLADSVAKAAAEFAYEVSKPNKEFVRPPGSADEETFLSLCLKCKSCVEACRTGVLELVKEMNPVVVDTPVMNFENNYCERCYSCVDACKSNALTWDNLKRFRYVARLDVSRCVAYQGVFCQTCYWSCPKMDKAITLKDFTYPEFHEESCLGCGRCVHACPTVPKSIRLEKVKNG